MDSAQVWLTTPDSRWEDNPEDLLRILPFNIYNHFFEGYVWGYFRGCLGVVCMDLCGILQGFRG